MKKQLASLFVITAGALWGLMGIFVRTWSAYGFSSIQVSAIRLVSCAVLLNVMLPFLKKKTGARVKLRDLPLLAAMGICSVLLMSVLYFSTIQSTSLCTAAILLYLSPVVVMLMSVAFLKERVTRRKIVALVLAIGGCVLVAGIGGEANIRLTGVLTGVGSAVAYALYSILGTFALRKHEPLVVTTIAFTFAAIGAVFVSKPLAMFSLLAACPLGALKTILLMLLTGAVTAAAPYALYTVGLQNMEASRAAILACVEPLVAALCGGVIYHEPLGLLEFIGITLILAAIVTLNTRNQNAK